MGGEARATHWASTRRGEAAVIGTGRRADTGCTTREAEGARNGQQLAPRGMPQGARLCRLAPPLVDALPLVVLVELRLVALVQAHHLGGRRGGG